MTTLLLPSPEVKRFALLAVLLVVPGCGNAVEHPKTAPVSGTVMYKGVPVEGATVSFWSEGASQAAVGITNTQGEFRLSMFSINDGAIPGKHKITVSKVAGVAQPQATPESLLDDPTALSAMTVKEGEAGPQGPKSELPEVYGSLETTTLKETVTESGPNRFVLQLAN